MKFIGASLVLATAATVTAQSTVTAPCGTACPTSIPDKMITRTMAPTPTSPCPSLMVSTLASANASRPTMAMAGSPGGSSSSGGSGSNSSSSSSPKAFTGGAVGAHQAYSIAGVAGAVVVAAAAMAL